MECLEESAEVGKLNFYLHFEKDEIEIYKRTYVISELWEKIKEGDDLAKKM